MDKSTAEVWRNVFANWPQGFRRKGVLIPSYGENIAFIDFVITDDVVVLERATPDGVGARRVMIPFGDIDAFKYTEPLKSEQFLEAGFRERGMAQAKPSAPATKTQRAPQRPAARQPNPAARRAPAPNPDAAPQLREITPPGGIPNSIPPQPSNG